MKELRLTLNWVLENCGATKIGAGLESLRRKVLTGISTDSRTIGKGEIFVALSGEKFDGHSHAAEAIKKGALAVLAHKPIYGEAAKLAIIVPDTLAALGDLAHALRKQLNLKVIGLTGSNGKTTTKEMISAILALTDPALLFTKGNFNNLVGLPLTIFRATKETKTAVLEMGMNHFGEISRLTEIAEPDVALITSVGPAHLEFFGTVSQVAKAKGELYQGLKRSAVAVVNADEPLLVREARHFSGNKFYFGSVPEAQVRLGRITTKGLGQSFTLYGPGAENGRKMTSKLLGPHNVHNALAAAATALAAGAEWDQIEAGLRQVENYPGRLFPLKTKKGLWVLDDSYNANPASVAAGLRVLAGLKNKIKGAILGDMLELGRAENASHREIGRLAAELNLDFLALVGRRSRQTAAAARKAGLDKAQVVEFETPQEAAKWVSGSFKRGAAVLVKGSRSMKLEGAVEFLKEI